MFLAKMNQHMMQFCELSVGWIQLLPWVTDSSFSFYVGRNDKKLENQLLKHFFCSYLKNPTPRNNSLHFEKYYIYRNRNDIVGSPYCCQYLDRKIQNGTLNMSDGICRTEEMRLFYRCFDLAE